MVSDIPSPLSLAVQRLADFPALITADLAVSYQEYDRMVRGVASGLTGHGVRESDRVALLGDSSVDYIVTLMALLKIKAVACPLSDRLPHDTIKKLVRLAACEHLIVFGACDDAITLSGVNRIETGSLLQSSDSPKPVTDTISLDREATILFTSGSSGEPKGVLHRYGNHYYSALGANRNIPFEPGDRWLLSLPLYHVGGIGILFRALLGGGAVVIPSAKQETGQAILQHNVTHVSLVPTQLHRLLEHNEDLSRVAKQLKAVLLGGGPVPERLIGEALKYRLPLHTSYGLTEMASQVTTIAKNDPPEKLATSGRILEHREVKISREGEILVRGKTLSNGYVRPDRPDSLVNGKGWFTTGDMGELDSDGYLTVTGRKDNMFISGGENIHPEEIEAALCLFPSVTEALVVPKEDNVYGFRPVAFVRQTGKRQPDDTKLISHLKGYLPSFKIPDTFYAWPDKSGTTGLKPSRVYFTELVRRMNEKKD